MDSSRCNHLPNKIFWDFVALLSLFLHFYDLLASQNQAKIWVTKLINILPWKSPFLAFSKRIGDFWNQKMSLRNFCDVKVWIKSYLIHTLIGYRHGGEKRIRYSIFVLLFLQKSHSFIFFGIFPFLKYKNRWTKLEIVFWNFIRFVMTLNFLYILF